MSKDVYSFEWFGHHKLLRYFIIEAKVINSEPLRVGTGRGASVFEPVDLVVLKTYDASKGRYLPVIPGSSWKGVFRSHAYRLCRTYGLNVCEGVPGSTCLRGNEFLREALDASLEAKLRAIVEGNIPVCLLDLIFGGPGILSHIKFSDSLPLNEARLGYRTMVAIDRRTGASRKGALFSVEYVEPGAEFSFRLVTTNLPNYALGLLAEVLKDVNDGIVRIGGLKSRGFGRIKFEELRIRIREYGGKALRALDPIDGSLDVGADIIEGNEAWRLLNQLINVWRRSLDMLRKVSNEGWRWGVVLG